MFLFFKQTQTSQCHFDYKTVHSSYLLNCVFKFLKLKQNVCSGRTTFFFFKHRHLYVFQMKLLVDFFSHKMLICTKIFLGMKSMWFCPPCEYRWNHKFSTLRYFFIAFIWITKDLFAVTFLSRGSACSKVRKMI